MGIQFFDVYWGLCMKKGFAFVIIFILFFSTWVVSSENTEVKKKEDHSVPNPQADLKGLGGNYFTLNKGQVSEPDVVFHSQNTYFTPTGVIFRVFGEVESTMVDEDFVKQLHGTPPPQKMHIYKMNFLEANPVIPTGIERIDHNSNFFFGN